jgi:hypothetical protein
MCIDNFSVSHGRQPTYDLGRKILVAWSNPLDKTSLQLPSVVPDEVSCTKESAAVIFDDKLVPGAVAATPDSTPDSTLTSEEAEDLRDLFALNMAVGKIARNDSFHSFDSPTGSVASHKRNKSCPVHIDDIFN